MRCALISGMMRRVTNSEDGEGGRGRSRSAAQVVVDRLEQLIFGDLDPGASLPSETELAAELGVSRLTVREAIRTLEARALLEVSHGRRPMVAHPSAMPLRDFFSGFVRRDPAGMMDLLDVRLAIEVHAAQSASRNATASDLSRLEATLEQMRRSVDDDDAYNEADVRFHAAIASATGNRLLSFMLEGMAEPLKQSRAASLRGFRTRPGGREELTEKHAVIFRRIADRDPTGAAEAMRDHLLQTRADLRAAFAMSAGTDAR